MATTKSKRIPAAPDIAPKTDQSKGGWKLRQYVVGARNGYWAVDCVNGKGFRTVEAGLTRKQAERLAYNLNDAVYLFMVDNQLT